MSKFNPFPHPTYQGRRATAEIMINQLGLMKLPAEGVKPRLLNGIWVWVKPAGTRKHFAIRVMCVCPGCGLELAASRLHQHIWTDSCRERSLATQEAIPHKETDPTYVSNDFQLEGDPF